MGRITFSSVFLASPIAFVGCPALASFSPHTVEATSVSVKFETNGRLPENRQSYVIVDVPTYMRPEVTAPFQNIIVAEGSYPSQSQLGVTSRNLTLRGDAIAETASFTNLENSSEPGGDLIDAVIEDHSRRVEFLRKRIETLRLGGGDPLTISGLKVRLKRAEAARSVALARRAIDELADAGCKTRRNGTCVLAIATTHNSDVQRPRKPVQRHTMPSKGVRPSRASLLSVNNFQAHKPVRPTVGHRGSTARLLASAKHSLATARSQLAGIPAQSLTAYDRNETTVAGLLRWPGSEAWSLSAQRA